MVSESFLRKFNTLNPKGTRTPDDLLSKTN